MSDHPETPSATPSPDPDPVTVTLLESAWSVLADLDDLVKALPGDLARNALVADRLSEELAEIGERLRSMPGCPREMPPYGYPALMALRSARAAREDLGAFVAATLARLAAEMGGTEQVLASRPGSWEAGHLRDLMRGTTGPGVGDDLPPTVGGPGGSL